jgi:predicted phosphodiesterase
VVRAVRIGTRFHTETTMSARDARYLVLSDMHFGTPESSVNSAVHLEALVRHVASRGPWEEVIFTGDLLDANLSTLTRAIEGRRKNGSAELCGFRQFVEALDRAARANGAARGLADLASRWVYVPGNHDYKVWDLLATRVVCEDVIARGEHMGSVPTPLQKYRWAEGTSFFAGIFRPFGVQERVIVEYPNHEVSFADGARMVFTHGHYLDPSQTRGNDLAANFREARTPADVAAVVRRIVIETAQYQAVASAVSFTEDARRLVSELVGPDGWLDKLHKLATAIGGWVLRHVFARDGSLRGKALSERQLANAEIYLERFCGYDPVPRWFVFGHTHRQGKGRTSRLAIDVYNAGSCYPDSGWPITFLEIEAGSGSAPAVQLMCVDDGGRVRPSA